MRLSHTQNPRGDSDAWGGADPAPIMHEAVVAAVNAYITSQAALLLSPSSSLWTLLTAAVVTTRTDCGNTALPACPDVAMAVCVVGGRELGRCCAHVARRPDRGRCVRARKSLFVVTRGGSYTPNEGGGSSTSSISGNKRRKVSVERGKAEWGGVRRLRCLWLVCVRRGRGSGVGSLSLQSP